ncbi:MAG TPA: VWA domain-containing protein [Chloroflexi bacterium]|nr:VWA domain-containing protein [Chloroflexota bacterium]
MMNESHELSLTCSLNTPILPITDTPRLLYLLVEIHRDDSRDTAALPVNLALVVDVSESMHIRVATDEQFKELARMGALQEVLIDGVPAWHSTDIPNDLMTRLPRKIDRVQDALRAAVEQLRPADRFSLVAFAGQAVTLVPNTRGSEKRRLLDQVDGLDDLQLGDDTYIGQGMGLGIAELRREASSDLANRLLVLTDGFTSDEMDCRQLAVQASQIHIPISTMGLGGEFNEELMIPIADQTGGEAYLVENPEDIPAAFAQELERAQAVHYRNLELKLRPSQGIEIRAAYRVRPSIAPLKMSAENGSHTLALGDLVAGDEPALLLELIVPPRLEGTYRLAQVLLACDHPAGGLAGLKTRADVVAEFTSDATETPGQVASVIQVVEALSAYKLQRNAQADLKVGNVAGATRKLRAAATRLLDMGQEELAAEADRQASELEQHGQADPRLTKKLHYETRKLAS